MESAEDFVGILAADWQQEERDVDQVAAEGLLMASKVEVSASAPPELMYQMALQLQHLEWFPHFD